MKATHFYPLWWNPWVDRGLDFEQQVSISIDNLADQTDNIGQPKQTLDEKIQARILYENSKVTSLAS